MGGNVEDRNKENNDEDEDVNADNDTKWLGAGAGEECNAGEDNDLSHVHWCVCLRWRKAPLLHSLFSCVISHSFTLCFLFLRLHRLTWNRRGRCTWSLICLDPPPRVRPPPPQHTAPLLKQCKKRIRNKLHV